MEHCELVIGVVLHNNSTTQLIKLFKTVHASARACGLSYQVVAWNNGRAVELPAEMEVKLLNKGGNNLGFGKGQNRLMAWAFSEEINANYYLCLNPDGLLHIHALTELINMAQGFENKALIEAAQVPVEHPKDYDPLQFDTAWVSGACFLMPKEIYQVVGGFDEAFFMYCEDVDLSWRVKKQGFLLKFCPRAWFYHDTSDKISDLVKDKILLLAGRYLAAKWSMQEFKEKLEAEMLRREMFPNLESMPPLDNLKEIYPFDRSIVEDRQGFHFALPRWE